MSLSWCLWIGHCMIDMPSQTTSHRNTDRDHGPAIQPKPCNWTLKPFLGAQFCATRTLNCMPGGTDSVTLTETTERSKTFTNTRSPIGHDNSYVLAGLIDMEKQLDGVEWPGCWKTSESFCAEEAL